MIEEFDDFCLYMYVIVDEIWQEIAFMFRRPGPEPECSDSKLLTMTLVGECRGWDVETEMLSHWHEHRDLFPVILSQRRFNRRRRYLHRALNHIRRAILEKLDLSHDPHCVIDSLPLGVRLNFAGKTKLGILPAYGEYRRKQPTRRTGR